MTAAVADGQHQLVVPGAPRAQEHSSAAAAVVGQTATAVVHHLAAARPEDSPMVQQHTLFAAAAAAVCCSLALNLVAVCTALHAWNSGPAVLQRELGGQLLSLGAE